MAHLVKQPVTNSVDAAGKRVPKGTPDAKRVRTRATMVTVGIWLSGALLFAAGLMALRASNGPDGGA